MKDVIGRRVCGDCSLEFPGAASRGSASTGRQVGGGRRLPGSLGPSAWGVCVGWGDVVVRGVRSIVQATSLPTSATCGGPASLTSSPHLLSDTCPTNSEPAREGSRHFLDCHGLQGGGGGTLGASRPGLHSLGVRTGKAMRDPHPHLGEGWPHLGSPRLDPRGFKD